MDAKYNKYLDSVAIRLTLITVGFAIWLGAAYGLMQLI
jgi:hypothetical protein